MLRKFPLAVVALSLCMAGYAGQPGESVEAKANQCVGCHGIEGYRSVFPEVYPVPEIDGQSAAYIEYALKAYRSGERYHPSMTGVAAQLSDRDIEELAAFYAAGGQ